MKILVLNGVNLGRLGKRQPEIYGFDTLRALNKRLKRYASAKNITLKFFQTDSEPALLKKINRVSLDAIIFERGGMVALFLRGARRCGGLLRTRRRGAFVGHNGARVFPKNPRA